MLIQRAYQFRLEPTEEQTHLMSRFAGSARWVWNHALALQKETFASTGKRLSYAKLCRRLTEWKQDPELAWLKETPIHALQQSLKHLDTAYQRFFNKALSAEEPRFKKKGRHEVFKESDRACFQIQDSSLRLPKLGWVLFRPSREIEGTPKNITVSKKGKRWFVSIQVELEREEPQHPSTSEVGIDMGVAQFATLSDGTMVAPLHSFKKLEDRLALAQRKLSRKVKFSNN